MWCLIVQFLDPNGQVTYDKDGVLQSAILPIQVLAEIRQRKLKKLKLMNNDGPLMSSVNRLSNIAKYSDSQIQDLLTGHIKIATRKMTRHQLIKAYYQVVESFPHQTE